MKNEAIPKLRFKGFKNNYENNKLGEVSKVFDGVHQTPKYVNKGIPFISVENINTLTTNKYITKRAFINNFKYKMPSINDIVMTRIGTIGKVNILNNINVAYYVTLALIHPNHNYLLSYYLLYLMQSNSVQRELWRRTLHVAFPQKINKDEIPKIIIIYPSLLEQRQIGIFFATLDYLIQLQQKKVTLLKRLKRAYLQRLFHNSKTNKIKLSNLCSIKTGNKNAKDDVPNGRYPFFDRSIEIKHLNTYDYNEETIIYAGEGEKFLPRYYNGKYSLHQRAYSLYNFKTDIVNVIYLYEFLLTQSHRFIRYAVGTTVKSLRMDCFKHVYVPIISLKNQKVIGKFLLQNSKIIKLCVQNIHYLRKLKKAYLQKMFC